MRPIPKVMSRWRSWRRRLVRILGVVGAVLLLAALTCRLWLPPVLRSVLVGFAESGLALRLEVDEIVSDGWSFVELHGLTALADRGDSLLQDLAVDELRVEFRLGSLMRGQLSGVTKLRVNGLRLRTGPAAASEPDDPDAPPWQETLAELWPQLPALQATDLRWTPQSAEPVALASIEFRPSADRTRPAVLDLEGEYLALVARLSLKEQDFQAEFDLRSVTWQAGWAALLPVIPPDDFTAQGTGRLRVAGTLSALADARWDIEDFSVSARQPAGTLDLQLGALSLPERGLAWRALLPRLQGSLRLTSDRAAELAASWSMDLPTAMEAISTLDLQARWSGGELLFERAAARDRGLTVVADGSRVRLVHDASRPQDLLLAVPQVLVHATLEEDRLLADGRSLPAGQGTVRAAMSDGIPLDRLPASLRVRFEELAWQARDAGIWLRQEQPTELLWDQAGLRLDRWALATPAGSLSVEATLALPLQAELALQDGPLSVRLQSSGFDLAELTQVPGFSALPVAAGAVDALVLLDGTRGEPRVHAELRARGLRPAPAYALPSGPQVADLSLDLDWDREGLRVARIDARDEAVSVTASGTLDLPLQLDDMRATTWTAWRSWRGTVELDLTAADTAWLTALLPAEGSVGRSLLPPGPLRGHAVLDWQDGLLSMSAAELAGETVAATLAGSWQAAEPQGFRLHVESSEVQPDWLGWRGRLELLADLEGSLTGPASGNALSLSLHGEGMQEIADSSDDGMPPFDLVARVVWDERSLRVEELVAQGARVQLDALAEAGIPFDATRWAELELDEVPVQGSAEARIEELSWLAALPALRRSAGDLRLDGTLAGTIASPRLEGGFDLTGGSFRLASAGLPPISALELHGVVDVAGLRLHDSSGELGAAPFLLEGSAQRDDAGQLVLDLLLSGKDLLWYRADGIRIRADTDLTVQGPWPRLRIGGQLALTDSRLVQDIDLLRSPIGPPRPPTPGGLQLFTLLPPLDEMQFDLRLTGVEGLSVRSNLARGRLRPDLRLVGTGAVPELRGQLFLEDVSMSLPATRLYLQPSVARFLEDDPFHPQLSLFGRSRLQGYDVQVVVTGPYDQPRVVLSSSPPLAEDDLLVLLTTGQPPSERFERRAAAGTAALYLARDFLTTFFGSDSVDAEESLLDRLEITIGADRSRDGVETMTGRLLLREGVLRDGDSLYLEGGRDAFEDFFLGLELLFRFP